MESDSIIYYIKAEITSKISETKRYDFVRCNEDGTLIDKMGIYLVDVWQGLVEKGVIWKDYRSSVGRYELISKEEWEEAVLWNQIQ